MKPICSLFAALALAGSLACAAAQDVAIPDPGLNAAIRSTLQKPTGPLTELDLLSLTNLNAPDRNIRTIEGLEAARNLTFLGLKRNALTNFAVPSQLTNLAALDVSFNSLVGC